MVTRIGKRQPPRLYIDEWIEKKNLDHTIVGQRMDPPVSRTTVWRWVNEPSRLNPEKMAALAEAIGLESPTLLWCHPGQPSADELLRGQSPELVKDVLSYIEFAKNRRAS